MESCLKIGGKYWHGLGALLYKMGKISTLSRATTQNTTTTRNNQHEPLPPYPSAALTLSLHGQAVGATNQWRRCFLLVPRKAPMVGFGGAMAGLPALGDEKRRIKKQRDEWGSRLRFLPFDDGIQQST